LSKAALLVFALLFTLAAPAQWVQRADALRARSEVTSVVYKNKLYTFLGFSNADLETNSSSEVYDPATNTWQMLASIPEGKSMTHQGVVQVDNTVWFIGGRVGKHPGPVTSETWIYNFNTNAWSPGPSLKDPASGSLLKWGGGGAALIGRTLHVFGGFVGNACSNDQDKYHLTLNVDTWLTTGVAAWKNDRSPLPVKRCHLACVVLGGKIYALGGQSGHDCGDQDLNVAHVYNPATDSWKQLPNLSAPRSHAEGAVFAMDGKLYIVAGQQLYSKNTNKVTVYDPSANSGFGQWSDHLSLSLPFAYEGVSAKVIGNTFIYSHGGKGISQNVQRTTYTRTITRNPVRKLGFLSSCLSVNVPAGGGTAGKNLLFAIDGTPNYQITVNVPWLSVTRNATGTTSTNGTDVEVRIDAANLAPGTYKGTFTATGSGDGAAYAQASFCVNLTVEPTSSPNPPPTPYQAEAATVVGAQVSTLHAGYTGTGFVDFINQTGEYVEWTVNQVSAGNGTLTFRYANGDTTSRSLRLSIDGTTVSEQLSFPVTNGWSRWSVVRVPVTLAAGARKVRLSANGALAPNLDYLEVSVLTATRQSPSLALSPATRPEGILYPNPATERTQLTLTTHRALHVQVISPVGKVVRQFRFLPSPTGTYDLSLADLPRGVYLVQVQGPSKPFVKRLVVQ
jgi:hypothetical protein